jgi:hypothetical protein
MNNDPNVISYRALRQLIGILGMALPFLCWGVNAFVNHAGFLSNSLFVDRSQTLPYNPCISLKSSISHFYYTAAGPLFTGILITVAIFLFCYKGHRLKKEDDRVSWLTDNLLATFAAICALGVVIFPTGSEEKISDNIHIFVASEITGYIHLGFATLFFVSIAVLCIINFRRNPGKVFIQSPEGTLYLVCGWGMLSCLALLAVVSFTPLHDLSWMPYNFIYIMETVMLVLFGTAWLVKGKSTPTQYVFSKLSQKSERK